MSYSVCVIDDGINAVAVENSIDPSNTLTRGLLSVLLRDEQQWGTEIPLYNLCKMLVEACDTDNAPCWTINAFSHPNNYINSFNEDLLRCDVIIYDWDYSPPVDHEKVLIEILRASYCVIYIYSGADKIPEIEQFMAAHLVEYGNRVFLLDKQNTVGEDSTSPGELFEKMKILYNTNFSFKFGSALRGSTNLALDQILLRLSELHIEQTLTFLKNNSDEQVNFDIKQMIGEKIRNHLTESCRLIGILIKNGLRRDKAKRLIDFAADKVKSDLIASELTNLPDEPAPNPADGIYSAVEALWSYRLYFNPGDNEVRRGDIIYRTSPDDFTKLFLIITADCDIAHFWKKNLGFINLVPLYSATAQKDYLKELASLTKNSGDLKKIKSISSFTNAESITMGGTPLYIPFVKTPTKYDDYLAFPKEIMSVSVPMPAETRSIQEAKKRDIPLLYDYWSDYKRLATVSEPFLTPTIEHILRSIAGYGTPDYPTVLQDYLALSYKGIYS